MPPLDDEMGEDPPESEEEVVPQTPVPEFIPLAPAVGMRPPPPSAVVSDPNGTRPEGQAEAQIEPGQGAPQAPEHTEEAGPPAPSLGPPGPATPISMLTPADTAMEVDEAVETSG